MVKKKLLSHNAMDKIMREAGALRVSDDAKATLAEVLEKKALENSVNPPQGQSKRRYNRYNDIVI